MNIKLLAKNALFLGALFPSTAHAQEDPVYMLQYVSAIIGRMAACGYQDELTRDIDTLDTITAVFKGNITDMSRDEIDDFAEDVMKYAYDEQSSTDPMDCGEIHGIYMTIIPR